MKRYRDPTPALDSPEPPLSAWQQVLMYVTLGVLVAGAVWISVVVGP